MVETHEACILVVDDSAPVRQAFSLALERVGLRVITAADGRSALALAFRHHPDVVLLDACLPDMSGEEVMASLRRDARGAQASIIMVSGVAAVARKVEGLRGGANDYLSKPVWPEELLARVHAQIRVRNHWRSRIDSALSSRLALSRLLVGLDTHQDLPSLVDGLATVLRSHLDLDAVAVSPLHLDAVGPAIGDHEALRAPAGIAVPPKGAVRAPITVPHSTHSQVHLPLAAMGSTFAILTVTTRDHTGQALATLVDLGPQISALLHQAVSTEVATSRDRGEIEVALAPGGLRAVFQPIVALPHVAVVGFEGLSRFHDGCRPDRRFNHARRIGLGAALERRAIEEVMAAATRLPSDVWVSVNVSAETLLSTDLADLLRQRDRRVRLEITEHEQVGDYAAVMDAVARLDGVELGVDDAGAGYASLRHVYELRPTMVKLDRAWVAGIDGDPMRRALLIGLQHFVNEFGAELLGEGVERAEDSATLSQLGVPLAQGYLYGRPAPPEEWT